MLHPESVLGLRDGTVKPYFVYIRESVSLSAFASLVSSTFGQQTPLLDFVGGQNRSVIVYSSLNQLLDVRIVDSVESLFELPPLSTIEMSVLERLLDGIVDGSRGDGRRLSIMIHYLSPFHDAAQFQDSPVSVQSIQDGRAFVASLRVNQLSRPSRFPSACVSCLVLPRISLFLYQQRKEVGNSTALPLSRYLEEYNVTYHPFTESSAIDGRRSTDSRTQLYELSGSAADLLPILFPAIGSKQVKSVTLADRMQFASLRPERRAFEWKE